jgi:DUF4097 and DUF4098 domain-containing protein YvlB
MKTKLLLCFTALLLATTSLSAEEWKRDFTVSTHPQLRVQTNDASVEVHGAPGNTISVRVVAEGRHIGPGELSVNAQQTGDSVSLQVKIPERHIHLNFSQRPVRIEISVPEITALDLSLADGSMRISGTKGDTRLGTSDGSIRVDNFDGNLHAHTADGSVEVSGRFVLLDLSTSDGRITASVWKGSHMNGTWNLRTADGSITLRLPDDLSAFLDAWTGDGHIDLQLPVEVSGRVEKNRVRGKIHGGGPTLHIHTSDGSITLRSL